MDKIIIPASITLENSLINRKYKWKSKTNKTTIYKIKSKRAFVRFSCRNLSYKLNKLDIKKRKININFLDDNNLIIERKKEGNFSIQGYQGRHPYVQFVVNSALPASLKERFAESSKTFSLNIIINLTEWRDLNLSPSDFIIEIEKESKSLLDKALENKFKVVKVSKGREFDVGLTAPSNKKLVIAISSHVAANKSRGKEKTIQKILMDISKMLPYLHENKEVIPIIITRPIEFENSWSFTTKKYLDFYKNNFGFVFLTTEFKKGWEDDIIKELLKI